MIDFNMRISDYDHIEIHREGLRDATKDHKCMASDWLIKLDMALLSFTEKKTIIKARRNGFRIEKGSIYRQNGCRYKGRFYSYKAIPAMHDLCIKYELFDFNVRRIIKEQSNPNHDMNKVGED